MGNPCGKPYDIDMQRTIVGSALDLFETVTEPGSTTVDSHTWGSDEWRQRYMELKPEMLEKMKRQGEERRRERQHLRDIGHVRKD